MVADLKNQLANIYPFYGCGRKPQPYNDLSVEETYQKFKSDFLSLCPLTDKLNRVVKIDAINFRKLLNLKHKTLGAAARAHMVIKELENGTFDKDNYDWANDRIRTLFWVPEVITDPDAIYENNHKVVKADEVYICVYDKGGSKVKLAFTSTFAGKVEIVSTYLTDAKTAMRCIKGKPLYQK